MKKKKPKFKRQEGYRYKRLVDSWRKPRGRHSKLRMSEKARGRKPGTGYRGPKEVRGLTKNGYRSIIVSDKAGVGKLDPKKDAAVISSTVGRKKRTEIILEAEKSGLNILNAYKFRLKESK